jgi:hypothetical protein
MGFRAFKSLSYLVPNSFAKKFAIIYSISIIQKMRCKDTKKVGTMDDVLTVGEKNVIVIATPSAAVATEGVIIDALYRTV